MLVLFDIDMTLFTTSRSGMAAMTDAGQHLFGPHFTTDGIEFGGQLDPLIVERIYRSQGRDYGPHAEAEFRPLYHNFLKQRLRERNATCRTLPGAMELLNAVRNHAALVPGVLTGNYAETGMLKLRAVGIDPDWFEVSVWGDESPSTPPTRNDLPRVAMQRWGGPARRGVIIGDTPHDVRCAKVNGLRCLAVATGGSSVSELDAAGADRVVDNLSDTTSILDWLLNFSPDTEIGRTM